MTQSVNQQKMCKCKNPVYSGGNFTSTNCVKCGGYKRVSVKDYNSIPSPHQEAWAERFDKTFVQVGHAIKYIEVKNLVVVDALKAFIRQELTTLHKADCERFRGMAVSCADDLIPKMNVTATAGARRLLDEILTALSKMEEEV